MLSLVTASPVPAVPPFDDDGRWAAVRARDAGADGAFLFAVLTTGVYCRPSCAARLPRRENVRFFPTCEAAEQAGFRACKRCRPKEPPLAERQAALAAKACRLIETALDAGDPAPSLGDLSTRLSVSRFHLHRIVKAAIGVTPQAYAARLRAERAKTALGDPGASVTAAIYDAGYSSSSRFYERSTERLGMAPRAYRSGGAGATIRFAVGACSLGSVLVAATDKGVCAIELGNDPDILVRSLQDRFPKADLVGGDEGFETLVAQVVGLVEDPARGKTLPLDVRGTAFQERVWAALRAIPPGETASYAEIARRIGAPAATRAVAGACAANPTAIAIPCHRVVRTDGGLSGYRWGVERKRALLDREKAA